MSKPLHAKTSAFHSVSLFADVKSFDELETRIAALPDEQARGNAFEVFAEAYLATQRRHDLPQIWPLAAVPTDVLRKLALPLDDYGVDGVAQTVLGGFDVYQVKFRSGRRSLSWRELSTFMGLADSASIHSRVLITNCDNLPAVMNERKGFFCIRGSDLDRLEEFDFRAIESWLSQAHVPTTRKQPRPHQQEALDVLLPALREHDRVTGIMACGTGKTLVAVWVAERTQSQTILVLLPSLALLRQTLHEWLHETSLPLLAYLCVCSDPTVKQDLDAIATQQSDLDFQVSTDAASVRSFLDSPFAGVKIIFSTYQSASVVGAAMQPGEAFDFAVFDEAHKTAGREGRNFAFALDDKNLSIRKRLFLTATPRHFDIRHRDKDGEFNVRSMDDASVYGPRAYTLSFATAAKKGIICRYKVIISLINKQMVSDFARKHGITLVEQDEISARWVANLIALKQAVEKSGAGKIITFHSRVKIAEKFAVSGPHGIAFQLDSYDVRHVNGSQSSLKRSKIIRAFADAPKSILTNARCLTEGVDIPAVDMVAFIDPRQSRVDIAQAVGRAMRKPRGKTTKTVGYVVVPLFAGMDERDNLEEAVHGEKFDEVADVLNALQEHDEEFVEIVREIKERKGRGEPFDPRRLNEKVQAIGPLVEMDRLSESIAIEIGNRIGVSWDEWFGLLQRYVARAGHCWVPRQHLEGAYKLGIWVHSQRSQRDSLPVERRQRLDALGFQWDPFAAAWEEWFAALERFKARECHCRVPARHLEGIYKLGQWANSQRTQRDSLPVERRQKLEGLGFDWDPLATDWEEGFAILIMFQTREGHCRISGSHLEGTYRLGQWVKSQRRRKDSLPVEQKQRLDALGFEWEPLDSAWEAGFASLQRFKARENNCRVPASHIEGTYRLGQWLGNQRRQNESLPVERRQRLEALGFEWDPYAAGWDEGFATLQKFYTRERHCRVPAKHFEGTYRLGQWVSDLRKKQDNTPVERRQKLEALGFKWDMLVSAWEEGYAALKKFQAREGHCRVPQQHIEGNYRLRSWVGNQRNQKDSMSADRRQRLDALGFIWNSKDAAWEEGFAALQQFQKREGHFKIPQQHIEGAFKLGHWVSHQRSDKDTMQAERRQRLDALGFVWNSKDAAWDTGFAALKRFKEREGHCRVSWQHIEGTYKLGQWVGMQRNRRDIMPAERRQRLDALGVAWKPSSPD